MSYLDDGHIVVCVRVRDVPAPAASLPYPLAVHHAQSVATPTRNTAGSGLPPPSGRRASGLQSPTPVKQTQPQGDADLNAICVSCLENIVTMHDPRSLNDTASVARDASALLDVLKRRESEPHQSKQVPNRGGGASATYFETDEVVVSLSSENMKRMPIVRDSDFVVPPPVGTQEDVYACTAAHAVTATLSGVNSCLFAYGQTNSGKTYTLFGTPSDPGVVPRSLEDLFAKLNESRVLAMQQPLPVVNSSRNPAQPDFSYRVQMSFFEIYQEEIFCLLSKAGPLKVTVSGDGSPVIHNLDKRSISSADEATGLIEMGLRRRQVGETGMNARSSRSHAIVQIHVQQVQLDPDTRKAIEYTSTLNLIDLAGSERQRTAKTEGKSHREGIQINQSLSTLARVINDVARGNKFVNYRDSMLTLLLKENLGGNSRTFMVATISPIVNCYQESCATLQYAKDVRRIRNRPRVNRTFQTREHLHDANLKLLAENAELRQRLEELLTLSGSGRLEGSDPLFESSGQVRELSPAADIGIPTADDANQPLLETPTPPMSLHSLCPVLLSFRRTLIDGGVVRMGGQVHVTALQDPLMSIDLGTYFGMKEGLGTIQFRTIAQRACHKTHWMSCLPPESPFLKEDPLNPFSLFDGDNEEQVPDVFVEVNGRRVATLSAKLPVFRCDDDEQPQERPQLDRTAEEEDENDVVEAQRGGESAGRKRTPSSSSQFRLGIAEAYAQAMMVAAPIPLSHGDVIVIGRDDSRHQDMLVLHFVDLSAQQSSSTSSTRSESSSWPVSVSRSASTQAAPVLHGAGNPMPGEQLYGLDSLRARMDELSKELAKSQDENMQLTRTLEYHVQLRNEEQRSGTAIGGLRASPLNGLSPPRSEEGDDASPSPTARHVPPRPCGTLSNTVTSMQSDMQAGTDTRGPSLSTMSTSGERSNSAVNQNCVPVRETSRSVARAAVADSSSPHRESSLRLQQALLEIQSLQSSLAAAQSKLDSMQVENDDMELRLEAFSRPQSTIFQSSTVHTRDDEGGAQLTSHRAAVEPVTPTRPHVSLPPHGGSCTPSLARTEEDLEWISRTPLTSRGVDLSVSAVKERLAVVRREKELRQQLADSKAKIDDLECVMRSLKRMAQDDADSFQSRLDQLQIEKDFCENECLTLTQERRALEHELSQFAAALEQMDLSASQQTKDMEEQVDRLLAAMRVKEKDLKALLNQWKRRAMDWEVKSLVYQQAAIDLAATQVAVPALPVTTIPLRGSSVTATSLVDSRPVTTVSSASMTIAPVQGEDDAVRLQVLETNLKELEVERGKLHDQLLQTTVQLEKSRSTADQLILEVQRLTQQQQSEEASVTANTSAHSISTAKKTQLQEKLAKKTAELRVAEQLCEKLSQKLTETMKMKLKLQTRTTAASGMLKSEQGRHVKRLEEQVASLTATLAEKEEEIVLLTRLHGSPVGSLALTSWPDAEDRLATLRNDLESLLREHYHPGDERTAPGTLHGNETVAPSALAQTSYAAFSKQFIFTGPMIVTIRASMRILFDRLKAELYILNKNTMHVVSSLLGSVQMRPDIMFHGAMAEVRRVVSTMTKTAQRIGVRWTLTSDDAALYFGSSSTPLVDSDRRALQKALLTCLVWYDHWDSSAKSDHASYVELLRNFECVFAMARAVRRDGCGGASALGVLQIEEGTTTQLSLSQPSSSALSSSVAGSRMPAAVAREALGKARVSQQSSFLGQYVSSHLTAPSSLFAMTTLPPPPQQQQRQEMKESSSRRTSLASTCPSREATSRHHVPSADSADDRSSIGKPPGSQQQPQQQAEPQRQTAAFSRTNSLQANTAVGAPATISFSRKDSSTTTTATAAQEPHRQLTMPLTMDDINVALAFTATSNNATSGVPSSTSTSHPTTMRTNKSNPVSPRSQSAIPSILPGSSPSQKPLSAGVATRVNRMTEDELVAYCMKEKRHLVASMNSTTSSNKPSRSRTGSPTSRSRSNRSSSSSVIGSTSARPSSTSIVKVPAPAATGNSSSSSQRTSSLGFFRSTTPHALSSPFKTGNPPPASNTAAPPPPPSSSSLRSAPPPPAAKSVVMERQDSWTFLTKYPLPQGGDGVGATTGSVRPSTSAASSFLQRPAMAAAPAGGMTGPFASTLMALHKSTLPGNVLVKGKDGGMVPVPRLSLSKAAPVK